MLVNRFLTGSQSRSGQPKGVRKPSRGRRTGKNGTGKADRLLERIPSALGEWRREDSLRMDQLGSRFLRFMGWNPSPRVDLLDLLAELEAVKPGRAVLGIDDSGRPLTVDLNNADTSVILAAGCDGTGKSSLIRTLVLSLVLSSEQRQMQLAIIEPGGGHGREGYSGSGHYLLSHLPHCITTLAAEADEIKQLLVRLLIEVRNREAAGEVAPMLLLVIDELDSLLESGDIETKEILMDLLYRSGASGLRVILGARSIEDPELLQFLAQTSPVRLIGRTRSRAHTQLLAGCQSECVRSLTMPGRFAAIANGYEAPFEAAYADDYDLHLAVMTIRARRNQSILAQRTESIPVRERGPEVQMTAH